MSNKKIEAPNYTQIPNVFFDNIMSKINGSEFKVLMAISRKTFGWHKEIDRISYSQIMEMAGISSKETVNNSIKKLVSKDIIKLEKVGQINYYSINVTEIVPDITSGSVISKVPDAGVHPFMSLTIHWYPVPGDTPLKIPVAFVIPLKVYE